jgi:hypothetical protein
MARDGPPPTPQEVEEAWDSTAAVLSNIERELHKRLEQLQKALGGQIVGEASPSGGAMVAYNRARVQLRSECDRTLAAFRRDFTEAQLKFERKVALGVGGALWEAAPMQRMLERYTRKVAALRESMEELAAKGCSVQDVTPLSISLLRYWTEHDRVMRQVYNALVDLDATACACSTDMAAELASVRELRQLVAAAAAAAGAGAGTAQRAALECGVEEQLLAQRPPMLGKVPESAVSFAEQALAAGGGGGGAEGGDPGGVGGSANAPRWSGGAEGVGVLQGWLRKKSPAAGRGWQHRWCVLHGAGLAYFKRESDVEPAGQINLGLLAACFATAEVPPQASLTPGPARLFCRLRPSL